MALTLAERCGLSKGMTHAEAQDYSNNNQCKPIERAEMQLKKIASEITDGTTLVSSLPGFSTFNPTSAQVKEWCHRILDNSGMTTRMFPAVISAGVWDTDGAAITDVAIRNSCLAPITAFMAAI